MRALAGCVLALMLGPVAAAPALALGVVYPDVPEPYRALFLRIVEGIEDANGGGVQTLAVSDDTDPQALAAWASRRRLDAVIALGRQGMEAARTLQGALPVVVGAVSLRPGPAEGVTGVSLVPEPGAVFARLRRIAPGVRRVHVVYSVEESGWLVARAKEAAPAMGLSLHAEAVADAREGTRRLLEMTRGLRGAEEAVWLLRDRRAVAEQVVLAELVRRAWEQGFVLFSSSPAHAGRGALFAAYPDSLGLGRRLARLAAEAAAGRGPAGIRPLEALALAVNLRTARHMGIELGEEILGAAEVVFPQR
ncbi:putative ABC transport system substrate-binding protein [Inmirania thermothiophila]|uniref:Putative ABC transport system substrate-binding protein n=1 Tax=Inmirania thermothiophila TaxID=1750597 RepID=A0A3N1Y0H8_9GAMM|nr:putative ABC transport system substrate-binding protein [Inmirania thermothiophila]